MKKTVLALALLLCTLTAVAADRQLPVIAVPVDGTDWLKLNSTEKLFWSIGYSQGYQDALFKVDIASGPETDCQRIALRTERQTATAGKLTGFELVSGLERFYAERANVFIPLGHAIRIYLLQAGGKDATTLQELIETARGLGAEARRAAAK